ncbi:hypothetical protein SAY87_024381 [Trapa incisa]|uniref:Uncharacterized protein n=1 Tax=Trapa incisa TaxID=236973 RepID=A0AAN7GJT8_9MYRT|nr:hypothetical protein SAY87_024381 [Trapa incisa]
MYSHSGKPLFGASVPAKSDWKGANQNEKRQGSRRAQSSMPDNASLTGNAAVGGYKAPTRRELQRQSHLQSRRFNGEENFNYRFAPYAPRNTSSFIMRAKKSGGIASLLSPCSATPSISPTLVFSPSTESLGDMAKEWSVDGYGSMKGLIRLRAEFQNRYNGDDNEEDSNGSSDSGLEEEDNNPLSRLDHETSRFELVCPIYWFDYSNLSENIVHDQHSHTVHLEEENLTLRERQSHISDDASDAVVENESGYNSEESSDARGATEDDHFSGDEYARDDCAESELRGEEEQASEWW